jgi:thiamine biosynthesis lipoprotein
MCILLLVGCASGKNTETTAESVPSETKDFFAMDTYMSVTAYGTNAEQAVEQAQTRVEELDEMLSTGNESSEISKLNDSSAAKLSEDAFYLMKRALEICDETEGAFNPTIYPLMELWGFTTGDYRVPKEKEIKKLLANMSPDDITLNENTGEAVFAKDGMQVDFGGIAKGYTSAEIMEIFTENGIESGMVSLGGNVQVLGTKTDGSLWKVAIQNPDSEEGYLGILKTKDKAVITSGGYERYFEKDGKTYHHILDPSTGKPAENGLTSVTIVSEDGTLADGLSTALFVMGTEKAKEFWKNCPEEFEVILYTDDGKLLISEGLETSFDSDYEVEVIRKGDTK